MVIFRILTVALVVFCLVLAFTHGIPTALAMFGVCSITLWAVMVLVEMFMRIGAAITRPHQHVHLYFQDHSDPTRPDFHDDEHPIIVLNETQWRKK